MHIKSVQTGCTTNVSRKCVPGSQTSDRECTIAQPRPRLRDVEGEAVGRVKMWPARRSWCQCNQIGDVVWCLSITVSGTIQWHT